MAAAETGAVGRLGGLGMAMPLAAGTAGSAER
jgi:hypothetical protein